METLNQAPGLFYGQEYKPNPGTFWIVRGFSTRDPDTANPIYCGYVITYGTRVIDGRMANAITTADPIDHILYSKSGGILLTDQETIRAVYRQTGVARDIVTTLRYFEVNV